MEIGEPISKQQRELFQRVLSIDDIVDISAQSNVSYSTCRDLYYRKASITDNNQKAVLKMINRAFEKVEEALTYFSKAKQELELMLPKHQV